MITVLRVLASFAIVGALLWLFMRASNGKLGALMTGGTRGRLQDHLAVVDRRQLTKNAGIALVRAGERHLLVGVSDQGVRLLAEGDDLAPVEAVDNVEVVAPGDRVAIVRPDDVVSDRVLTTPASSRTGQSVAVTGATTNDLPSAWTRFGRAPQPTPPRMSFVAALREMTVRRS
jgi:flagellar biogenesis protein FliO